MTIEILDILKFPHKNLLKKSDNVKKIDKNVIILIKNMIATMFHFNGIGIAAPQVNTNKNIIIINISKHNLQPLIIINPEIIYKKGMIISQEGCLSFPNIFIKIKRKKIITIKFLNIEGVTKILKVNNLLSICIQHEMDHLNGITLYNKMSKFKKHLLLKK